MMSLFNKLRYKINKTKWANKVILDGGIFLHELLVSEESVEKVEIMGIWQKRNEKEQKELRKDVLSETLLPIVQSENSIYEMRRAIMNNSRDMVMNRMVFDEEFRDQRQNIYDFYNKDRDDPETFRSDEQSTWSLAYCEPKLSVLRAVQVIHFEEIDWDPYVEMLKTFQRYMYRHVLKRPIAGGNEVSGLDGQMFQLCIAALDKTHRDLLDEPFQEGLDLPYHLT